MNLEVANRVMEEEARAANREADLLAAASTILVRGCGTTTAVAGMDGWMDAQKGPLLDYLFWRRARRNKQLFCQRRPDVA